MKFIFLCALFLFGFQTHSKNTADKILLCNERGCSCQGKGCTFVDPRIIKNASTVSITCPGTKSCAIKIVHTLFDKYGCKASVQKMQGQDYLVVTECLVNDYNIKDACPEGTKTEEIQELLKICLEIPKAKNSHPTSDTSRAQSLDPNPVSN